MPADSYSSRLRFRLQATGGNINTWGALLNAAAIQLIEDSIAGMANVTVANAQVTLSQANGATDQSRMAIINLTGAPTSPQNIVIPNGITKLYLVINGTGQVMTVTTLAGGAGTVAVPVGANQYVYCDGTNVAAVQATVVGAVANALALNGIPAADYARLDIGNHFAGFQAVNFVTLTDGATITLNALQSNNFIVTLGGNRTLAITNPADGQEIEIWFIQDATGGRTITWPGNVKFESGGTGSLSGTANALDRYVLKYNLASNVYLARPGLSSAPAGVIGVNITASNVGVSLFELAGSPAGVVTVNVTIAAGTMIYAPDANTPAFDCSGFASGSTINLVNNGYIFGKGGRGANGGEGGHLATQDIGYRQGGAGFPGGPALRAPGAGITFNVTNANGHIWGGGGGGGGGGVTWVDFASPGTVTNTANGGGGGGGAGGGDGGPGGQNGNVGGTLGQPGVPGSTNPRGTFGAGGAGNATAGSTGGAGGAGGDWGSGGAAGTSESATVGGPGGGGGKAIDLNGGTANMLSGGGGPNIKGLIA